MQHELLFKKMHIKFLLESVWHSQPYIIAHNFFNSGQTDKRNEMPHPVDHYIAQKYFHYIIVMSCCIYHIQQLFRIVYSMVDLKLLW